MSDKDLSGTAKVLELMGMPDTEDEINKDEKGQNKPAVRPKASKARKVSTANKKDAQKSLEEVEEPRIKKGLTIASDTLLLLGLLQMDELRKTGKKPTEGILVDLAIKELAKQREISV